MITFFVGLPGSGKSYEAILRVVDNLRSRRVVCTNIEGLETEECQDYLRNLLDMSEYEFRRYLIILDAEQVKKFWQTQKVHYLRHRFNDELDIFEDFDEPVEELICPKKSLIIIDEAHKHFNCRDYQEKANRELSDWASTHRHEGYDVIFITQNISKVEKQVRTLCNRCYFFTKIDFLGDLVKNKYTCNIYHGDEHEGKSLQKFTRSYRPEFFPCYKSFTADDIKETAFMAKINILKHPIFYAIPVVICLVLYMFFEKSSFASGDMFGTKKIQARYDKRISDIKTKPPASKPVYASISSNKAQQPSAGFAGLPASPLTAVAQSGYQSYKVEAFIQDNGTVRIMINGIIVKLPSPHVQSFDKNSGYALADSAYFGSKQAYHGFIASAPSLPMPDQSKSSTNNVPTHAASRYPW